MNVHGLGHGLSVNAVPEQKKPTPQDTQATPSTTPEAATAEISEEAKALSQKSGKANPHQVAEALGAKNFGQALKALREAGVELNSGFVSDLVHGDEEALSAAQEALAPPAPEESVVSETPVASEEQTTEPLPQTEENDPLVIDISETNLIAPDQTALPPVDETSLLETLIEEASEEDTSNS